MTIPRFPALCCLLVTALAAFPAAAQDQLWVRQLGSALSDDVNALAPDGSGGVFIAGQIWVPVGAPGNGSFDAWVAHYDAAGDQTWFRQFGTSLTEGAYGVAPDGSGGVFVAGHMYGTQGAYPDAWVTHFDAAGQQMWTRLFGTLDSRDSAWAVAPDGSGGVFVGGGTQAGLGGPFANTDAWLAHYDVAGNRTWLRQFGTTAADAAWALASDGSGGVFVGGDTWGRFGGPAAGGRDTWLARYDAAGDQTWLRQFGGGGDDRVAALAPDGSGGVFATGHTTGSLEGPSAGGNDAWLARYDSAGNRTWLRQFGTTAADAAWALASDGSGGAFVGGDTYGSFGGPSVGDVDSWLARYDAAGDRTWIRQFGTTAADYARALAFDGSGGAYFAGRTWGSFGGPNAGSADAWLARHIPPTCPADWNHDELVNSSDISAFLTGWLASVTAPDLDADFNGDGVTNSSDISAFLTAWLDAVQNGC